MLFQKLLYHVIALRLKLMQTPSSYRYRNYRHTETTTLGVSVRIYLTDGVTLKFESSTSHSQRWYCFNPLDGSVMEHRQYKNKISHQFVTYFYDFL